MTSGGALFTFHFGSESGSEFGFRCFIEFLDRKVVESQSTLDASPNSAPGVIGKPSVNTPGVEAPGISVLRHFVDPFVRRVDARGRLQGLFLRQRALCQSTHLAARSFASHLLTRHGARRGHSHCCRRLCRPLSLLFLGRAFRRHWFWP